MTKHRISTLPQTPCSPDVASLDIFLLPRLKRVMKRRYRGSVWIIQEIVTRQLKFILVSAFEEANSVIGRDYWPKHCYNPDGPNSKTIKLMYRYDRYIYFYMYIYFFLSVLLSEHTRYLPSLKNFLFLFHIVNSLRLSNTICRQIKIK